MMKQFLHDKPLESHSSDVLGIFVTLTDAKNFVRNHCASHAERDNPDATFVEGEESGCIWYHWMNEEGTDGVSVSVSRHIVHGSGSVSVLDWGQDIGEPWSPKKK